MATYDNDLRLKEITTGDEDGTWGTSTNLNLELIGEALSYQTEQSFSSDANATTTVADGVSDPARGLYFKVTSGVSLTTTRTLTIGPNTISRVMFIENATSGSQSIAVSQGSGSNVTVPNGNTKLIYLDGGGASAAVVDISSLLDFATLSIGGTAVTSTAAELNILDGVTATAAEINYLDITTLGTTQASKAVTADANGVVTFDNGISEEYTAVTSSSNATTVNLRDGTNFSHTLTEDTTFTFSNPASSGKVSSFTLKIVQDASASGYTVTWPTSVDWPSASLPITLSSTASAVDYFVFITHDGGTTWYGFIAGQAMS